MAWSPQHSEMEAIAIAVATSLRFTLTVEPKQPAHPNAGVKPGIYHQVVNGVVLVTTDTDMTDIGTGIVISPSGEILTSLHVVGSNTDVWVAFPPIEESGKF